MPILFWFSGTATKGLWIQRLPILEYANTTSVKGVWLKQRLASTTETLYPEPQRGIGINQPEDYGE